MGGQKNRASEIDSFRNDPDTRVLIANQKAGAEGLNLVESSYSIYYSRDYNLGHDLQSEARNHRGGSESHDKITRIDLITEGTIDEVILNALRSKKDMGENILANIGLLKEI